MPETATENSEPIKVMIVDDSITFRSLLRDLLSREPGIQVIGSAANGLTALDQLTRLQPDIITLDLIMPELDGVATVQQIRALDKRVGVLVCSSLAPSTEKAQESCRLGADDYCCKAAADPVNAANARQMLAKDLVPKIRAIAQKRRTSSALRDPASSTPRPRVLDRPVAPVNRVGESVVKRTTSTLNLQRPELISIGSSTGGPKAIGEIVRNLDPRIDIPIVIAQHMPAVFTQQFAERINSLKTLPAKEATDGERIEPGKILIAPGDFHMEVERRDNGLYVVLHQGPKEHSCRPAVDVLFRSVARVIGDRAIGIVLTGMGFDGTGGCRDVRKSNARVWIQDEATSVVWGMPGSVAKECLYDKMLPLEQIAKEINEACMTGFRPPVR